MPGAAIRPRSLRSRSTIIAFSARSFTDAVSRSRIASSSSSQRPRGAVPFIGRVVSRSPSNRKKSSGDADRIRNRPAFRYAESRASLRVAQVAIETALVALHRRTQPERVVHLIGVAGRDVFADALDRPVVAVPVHGRDPCVGRRSRIVARRRQDGLLALLEHREPGQRQAGERVVRNPRPNGERRVHPRRSLVGDEPRDPQAPCRGSLGRRERGRDIVRPHRLQDAGGIGQTERRRLTGQVVEPRLDHAALGQAPLRDLTSSISAGRNCSASATTPRSARRKIGASASLLIATIRFAPFMPTTCCSAPLIPTAM